MDRKSIIINTYILLKDNLEDDDDFNKLHDLIEQMAELDAENAFDMWYPLLSKYENYITKYCINQTYSFIGENLEIFGATLGYERFDEMILNDNYLYDLLIKKYSRALSPYDYTHGMLIRIMTSGRIAIAEKIFNDAYGNKNKHNSWFEVMDGFMFDIKCNLFCPDENGILLLNRWVKKIIDKKEKAKIFSAMLATGLDFNFDNMQSLALEEDRIELKENTTSLGNDLFCELLKEYPEALYDRKKLEALLTDRYPQDKLFVNTILRVFDEGIIEDIQKMSNSDILKKQRFVSRITNNFGIPEAMVEAAINAWIKGLKENGK